MPRRCAPQAEFVPRRLSGLSRTRSSPKVGPATIVHQSDDSLSFRPEVRAVAQGRMLRIWHPGRAPPQPRDLQRPPSVLGPTAAPPTNVAIGALGRDPDHSGYAHTSEYRMREAAHTLPW
jgi:hypothetical protein